MRACTMGNRSSVECRDGCINHKQAKVEEGGVQQRKWNGHVAFEDRKLSIFEKLKESQDG